MKCSLEFIDQIRIPYREHVCCNFELKITMVGWEYMNTWAINEIIRFLTKTHLALSVRKQGS